MLLSRYDLSISRVSFATQEPREVNLSYLLPFFLSNDTFSFLFCVFIPLLICRTKRDCVHPRGVSRAKITRAAPRLADARENAIARRYRVGVAIIIIIIIILHGIRCALGCTARGRRTDRLDFTHPPRSASTRLHFFYFVHVAYFTSRARRRLSLNGRSPARQLTLFIR